MNEHIVQPSGSIVKTLEWLLSHGVARGWYLHGRNGSAVIFQETYHSPPRIAMQGDKLLFCQENAADTRGYIVITQPEPDDDQASGVVRPANMIDLPGDPDYPVPPIDHVSGDPAPVPDGVTGRLYIAGPMTGLPEFNYPAFMAAATRLEEAGYQVENPATNPLPVDPSWEDCMRIALPQMLQCSAVVLLDGWENSRGARLEVHVARALNMDTIPLEEWFT